MSASANALRLQVILGAVDNMTKPLRHMLESSTGLSKAVKETRDRLRDLEAQQKRLEAFRKTATDVTAAAQALDAAKGKLAALRDQIIATERPSKNLTDDYKAQVREVRALERRNETLARVQQQVARDMQRAGVPVNDLA